MSGAQAGRSVSAAADGTFSFAAVPKELIAIRAEADGFESSTHDVSPQSPAAVFKLDPVLTRVHTQFLNDGRSWAVFKPIEIRFTVRRHGPVTVRARSDGYECGTYETFGVYLSGPSVPRGAWVYGCPAGVWRELTHIVGPGDYLVQGFYALWPWTTARREVELSYPG